jgi:general secretion pathway protein L
MARAIEQKLQQLRGRLRNGPVGAFVSWWLSELRLAMPVSWQQKLQHAMRRVTLSLDGDSLAIGVDENRKLSSLETMPLSRDAGLQRQEVDDLLERNELLEAPRFMLLDKELALVKELNLPLAAEANLGQVLSFEMDRQTPFRASGVYFDWQVLERNGASGQLRVKLFVVPRNTADRVMRALTNRGFGLAGIDVRDGDHTLGLNLLPAELRIRTINRKARLNLALGGACALLLAVVMAQSLYLRKHQVEELEAAIADVQGEARAVAQIRKQIEDASAAAGFLASRRAESPLAIELLADVTRLLPDDTYLDRLVIGAANVQMQGKSQNAQQLIEKVNESEMLDDAAFRGSTRLDARSGLEIFEVNARIVQQGVD